MTIHMRLYAGTTDIQPILDLKRLCTTAQNIYDNPTVSDLRELLAPIPHVHQHPPTTRPPWEDEHGTVIEHLYRRAMTQQATALWEEADGTLIAYALFVFPSTILTFQVHPQLRGSNIEAQILAWGIERICTECVVRGRQLSLWCRCHESETERRLLLENA